MLVMPPSALVILLAAMLTPLGHYRWSLHDKELQLETNNQYFSSQTDLFFKPKRWNK